MFIRKICCPMLTRSNRMRKQEETLPYMNQFLRRLLIFKGYIPLSQRFAQLVFRVLAAFRYIFLNSPFSKFRADFSTFWLKGIFVLSQVFSHQVTPGHILF